MSSDYGDDDEDFLLNLDDEDLRLLAEVEEKVDVSQVNSVVSNVRPPATVPSARGANPPPLKRAKVGERAPIQDAHMSDDDTPDILVNADGTYSLDSPDLSLVSLHAPSLVLSSSSKHLPQPVQQRSVMPTAGPSRAAPAHNGGTFATRPLRRQDSNNSILGFDTPPSTQGARPLVRAASLSQAISRGLSKNGAPSTQYPTRTDHEVAARPHDATGLQKEIEALRAQLAQVRQLSLCCGLGARQFVLGRPHRNEKSCVFRSRKTKRIVLQRPVKQKTYGVQ
jgi:hypothetical protein